ncbi:signal peptide peptidase SppA [Sphingomonas sp. NSE70-1]|uniref:Signal peptide peptidase SppA n=1 Tax=Sphingomonas caseinilyticus TaxID=2908205 RepID=A0ABT0RWK5_9SPHN|nr:signal peptide peptidase SppA [Sphingomonas caseinilyticus]MCL6699409.1 signal peptide peptidase SppA [Sphingomonas caseinilyticus]
MRFVRAIWKLLVGVKDALVLVFMLIFFGLLYAGLSAKPAAIGNGVLDMDLDGVLVEQASRPDPFATVAGAGNVTREFELRDLVAALETAKDDDRVKAISLDLDGFLGGGQPAIAALGEKIREVKKVKPVVAFATGYTADRYQIAAHASEIWMPAMGVLAIAGPGGNNLYFKGLLDKLGVTANVYRVGTYKAAVEPFTRSDMSPEARENSQALAGALLETWREDVARGRPAATQGMARLLGDPVGVTRAANGDIAKAALDLKLIDRVGERRNYEERLAELGGKDDDGSHPYKRIKLASYEEQAVETPTGPIGVVTIAGEIVDGKAGPGRAGGETIVREIEQGLADNDLKALVVRVDSPGGSAMASEQIRQALMAAKAKKIPVVVSMGNVAASGGYWVATPGDYVFAEPSTITGSIGVFGVLPSFEGSLAKLGLGADGVKTTPLSGEPDLLKGPSPEADAIIQAGVEQVYAKFLTIVAQARRKSPADVDRIAQGRVWDGGTARQLGLVDGFGGMDEAVAKAAELAKLGEDERGLTYLEKEPSFTDTLMEAFAAEEETEEVPADAFASLAPAPEGLLARAIAEVRSILNGPTIQVRCLDCPPVVAAPRLSNDDRNWLARLLSWS